MGALMTSGPVWWNGDRLGDEVALVLFAPPETGLPLLGAAATGTVATLLLPTEFGGFLGQHEESALVCYDVAKLHWALEAHFRGPNDTESLARLWGYSASSRLVDIALLDQHIRRCRGQVGDKPTPICRLVRCYTGVELPEDEETCRQIVAACKGGSRDDPALELAVRVIKGIFQVYESLAAEARNIEEAVAASQLPPLIVPKPPPEVADEMERQVDRLTTMLAAKLPPGERKSSPGRITKSAGYPRPAAPLGIGVDVRAAIAVGGPDRPCLRVAPDQREAIREKNEHRFAEACVHLLGDPKARRCFRWTLQGNKRIVEFDEQGFLAYESQHLKQWLAKIADTLRDEHNLPACIPRTARGGLPFDPEFWGVWVTCNRSLRAWRDLVRSAMVAKPLARAIPQPKYSIVPTIRARNPDLTAVRSLGLPVFRPREGHVFLVATLPELRMRCLAAVYTRQRTGAPSRLLHHFLETSDPIETLAIDLFRHGSNSGPVPRADERFVELSQDESDKYRRLAEVLMEVIPLGLSPSLLSVALEDYGLNIGGSQAEQLRRILIENVVYELGYVASEDVFTRLTRALGLTLQQGAELFAHSGSAQTIDAAIRNDLLDKNRRNRTWQAIHALRRKAGESDFPADDRIIERALKRCERTASGQVIGPAFDAEVRRQRVLLAADEVMKSVAYTLVSEGLPLVAVHDSLVVLELPEQVVTDALLGRVGDIALAAQREMIGQLARPCRCDSMVAW